MDEMNGEVSNSAQTPTSRANRVGKRWVKPLFFSNLR